MDTNGRRQRTLKEQVFELARFLHPNVTEAIAVTINALDKFDKADDLRYRRRINTKKKKSYRAELSDRQLAQQMVYEASEQFLASTVEIKAFATSGLALQGMGVRSEGQPVGLTVTSIQTIETVIIHFLKFLALITMRRNALYVTVGFCQLLRSLSTKDALSILENLKSDWENQESDDDRKSPDSQFRNIKSNLTKELHERFDLQFSTGAHGARHFVPLPNADGYHLLVLECLSRFVPWATSHVSKALAPLDSEVEIFHALLEPECFALVLEGLCIKHKNDFELPNFSGISQKGGGGSPTSPTSGQGPNGPRMIGMNNIQNDDPHHYLDQVDEELRKRAAARAKLRPEMLRVFINGKFATVLDLQHQSEVALEIGEGDRLVEVYAPSAQGDILLASLPIACDEEGGIAPLTVKTGKNSGFRFSFVISPTTNGTTEPTNTRANIMVKYQEPLLRRFGYQIRSLFTLRRVWRPSLTFVSLCLIAALIWNAVMVPVTAGDLVKKSISTEKAMLEKDIKAQLIPVRRVRLEEYRPGYSKAISSHYISTWNAEQKSTRLLSRDKNLKDILSGEWQQANGATSLRYKPETLRKRTNAPSQVPSAEMAWPVVKSASVSPATDKTPLSQSALSATGVELWRLSPDAADFQALIGSLDRTTVTESKGGWEIRYINPAQTSQQILSAYLKLDITYHAVAMSVTLRSGNESREFRFTEEGWEKKPVKEVDPKVFTPNPSLIEQPETTLAARTSPQAGSSTSPSAAPQTSAAKPIASDEVEIEVKAQLNQIGADLGREVEVERTSDNQLLVHGVVESKTRKEQILKALSSVKNNPAIQIRIQTKEEYLSGKPEQQVPSSESAQRENYRTLSRNVLKTADALHNFYAGKATGALEVLAPAYRDKLLDVTRRASNKYVDQSSELIESLRQHGGNNAPADLATSEIKGWNDLQQAVKKLYALSMQVDQEVASFSEEALNMAEVTRVLKLLGQARALARQIHQAAEKMN